MKKIINWTFGSFFRSLGRYSFYFFLGVLCYYISTRFNFNIADLLGIDYVHAEVIYNADNNPTNFRSAVRGITLSDSSTNYQGLFGISNQQPDFTRNDVILNDINDNDCNNGIMRHLGLGGYKTDYLLSCETTSVGSNTVMFNQIDFYFGSDPLSYDILLPSGSNYRLNILIASGPSVDISSDSWYWRNNYSFENATYKGAYNGFDVRSALSYKVSKKNNGGNLTWVSIAYNNQNGLIIPNTFNNRGLGFSLYIPISQYVFNSDENIKSYGQKEWFYVLDYKLEKVSSDNYTYDDSILTFDYANVKNDIWQTSDYIYSNSTDTPSGGSEYVPDVPIDTDLFNSDFILFYNFTDISSMNIFVDYDFSTFTDFEKLILTICFNILYLIFVIVVVYILLKALNKILTWVFR